MTLNSSIEKQLARIEQKAAPFAMLAHVKRTYEGDDQLLFSYFLEWLAAFGAIVEPGPELRRLSKKWENGEWEPIEEEDNKPAFAGVPLEELTDERIISFILVDAWRMLQELPSEFVLPDGERRFLYSYRLFLKNSGLCSDDLSNDELIERLNSDAALIDAG